MNARANEWGCHMERVARLLLGEPNARQSKPGNLRFGNRGSLSVDLAAGVWHDHENNTGGGVLELISREIGKQGPAAVEWLESSGIKLPAKKDKLTAERAKIVATYDYVDEHGAVLLQVCRMAPKDFRQRRPHPEKPGAWIWSAKGVKQIPYRLPQMLNDADALVFVVEGEKDADNLARAGLVATCNAGGANKWPDAITPYFNGRRVVILPDNDQAGQNHAALVSTKLHAVAHDVRVLNLPGLPEKGDVSDWLAAGGTAAKLLDLVNAAAPAKPVPAVPSHGFMVADSMAAVGVYLTTNDKREPHANLSNHIEVLSKHPRFAQRIWYDTFHQEIFTTWDCDKPRRWVDSDRLRVTAVLQKDYALVRFNDDQVEKAAIAVAHADQRDELRDWLTSLRWDGMPRLQGWLANTVGAPADDYHDAVGNNFIISMVARGMRPGCKADSMPVFEGDQGAGKSRLLALLGGEFYAELTESLETKDFFVVLQGKWLIEIAELDAFRRADVTRIKQVLSSHQDRCRLPYGRRAVDLPRRVVFAGTTNETEYLKDTTGARRFWPVAVSKIDYQWLADNREQLFAEAVECFNNGASWWEVPVEAAKEQTEARRETDAWETHIADHCRGRSEVVVSDVLQALGIEISRQGKPEQMRATRTLSILGYKRRKVKRFGKAVWAWQLPDAETAPF